jgi:hypothetical protein
VGTPVYTLGRGNASGEQALAKRTGLLLIGCVHNFGATCCTLRNGSVLIHSDTTERKQFDTRKLSSAAGRPIQRGPLMECP